MSKHMEKLEELGVCMKLMHDRQDQMLHLMKDMVLLEGKIERLEEKIDGQIKTLLDRVVEMSMVQQGAPGEANVHRAQTRLENNFSKEESWEEQTNALNDDTWPPPGHSGADVRG